MHVTLREPDIGAIEGQKISSTDVTFSADLCGKSTTHSEKGQPNRVTKNGSESAFSSYLCDKMFSRLTRYWEISPLGKVLPDTVYVSVSVIVISLCYVSVIVMFYLFC